MQNYCCMCHTVNYMHDKKHLQLLLPIQPTKLSTHMIFKGFSLEFSSYQSHSCANLDKLILLFSRATFNTVIKATVCRNISIQICKTQGKQIVLWAAELKKKLVSCGFVSSVCCCIPPLQWVPITVLLSSVTSLITMCSDPAAWLLCYSPYNLPSLF